MNELHSTGTGRPGFIPVLDEFELSGAADRVRKIVMAARDRSSLSEEIEDAITDRPTEYALSAKRANLLRGFDLAGVHRVLEIGCGCGPITRYLGDLGIGVDAIENSPVKAQIAHERCRGLENVKIHCADPERHEFAPGAYDLVLLVGFSGIKAAGEEDLRPAMARASDTLRRLSATLTDEGIVLVACENRHALTYMMGAYEGNHVRRFAGTRGYRGLSGPCRFGRAEWDDILRIGGLGHSAYYFPFPDYRMPNLVLSEKFVTAEPYVYGHLEGMLSRDFSEFFAPGRDENFLWEGLRDAGAFGVFANSFSILAGRSVTAVTSRWAALEFAHLPGFSRKKTYGTVTRKRVGNGVVEKFAVAEDGRNERTGDRNLHHRLGADSYLSGPLLSGEWARALAGSGSAAFEDELHKYWGFLKTLESDNPQSLRIDAVPINIVVGSDGSYRLFDQEWEGAAPESREFLLFRALWLFAIRYPWSLRRLSLEWSVHDIREYIEYAFRLFGLEFCDHATAVIGAEERFQRNVLRRRDSGGIETFLRQPLLRQLEPLGEVRLQGMQGGQIIGSVTLPDPDEDGRVRWQGLLPAGCQAMDRLMVRVAPLDPQPLRRFVNVERLSVGVISDGGSVEWIARLETQEAVAFGTRVLDMEYDKRDAGASFVTTGPAPAVELAFRDPALLRGAQRLQVDLDCRIPRSFEHLLARDRYLAAEQAGAERLKQAQERLKQAHDELQTIRSSRLWQKFLKVAGWVERYVHAPRRLLATSFAAFRSGGVRAASGLLSEKWSERRLNAYENWAKRKRVWEATETTGRTEGKGESRLSVIVDSSNTRTLQLLKTISSVAAAGAGYAELRSARGALSWIQRRCLLAVSAGALRFSPLPGALEAAASLNGVAAEAGGDYLAFVESGDLLAPNALQEVTRVLALEKPDLLFTDEDRFGADGHIDTPHFKTDYAPDLALAGDYIGNLLVIKNDLFRQIGGVRPGFDGAHLYDLTLRAVEATDRVCHLAQPLYHRQFPRPGDQGARHDAMRRAIADALVRRGIDGAVEDGHRPCQFRVRRHLRQRPPVSIVVPFRDRPDLLETCIGSVLEKCTYERFELLGVSNNTTTLSTFDCMRELMRRDQRVRFAECNVDFNFSRLVNFGVRQTRGEIVVLLNNDVEIITPDWIESMLEHAQRPEIGAVGAKLLFPDDTVQHAGIALGLGGYAGYPHRHFPRDSDGYFGRLHAVQNVSAVTAAMMMVRREVWESAGGFDEERFAIAYNDVDFCMRLRESGLLNVFTPYAEAYHRESASRGYEESTAQLRRFLREQKDLMNRHGTAIKTGDPYFNRNLDHHRDDFALAP